MIVLQTKLFHYKFILKKSMVHIPKSSHINHDLKLWISDSRNFFFSNLTIIYFQMLNAIIYSEYQLFTCLPSHLKVMKSYLPWWPDCVSVAPDTAPPVCSLPSPPSCAQSVTGLSPLLPNDFTGEKKYLVCEGGCQDKNLSWHAVKIRGIEICITVMMIRMCFLISRDHWVYLGRSTWSNRIYVQKLYLLIKKK